MPIKFRCQQCRQFLGISRAQAGEVVDCPTCGRTIRVPELDGTVKPLPKPGLKFDDTRLKHALDEIALIGDEPSRKPRPNGDSQSVDPAASGKGSPKEQSSERAGMATLDEPGAIELPPLPAPEPVALTPLPRRRIDCSAASDDEALSADSYEEDRPWRSTAQPRDSWKQLIAEAALKEQEEWNESQATSKPDTGSLGDGGRPAEASDGTEAESVAVQAIPLVDRESAALGFSTWFAIIGLITLICSAGFWIGRSTAISWSVNSNSHVDSKSSSEVTVGTEAVSSLTSGIEGRITWRSEAGSWDADRDACILVLPVDRKGEARVSFHGLQRNDSEEDRQMVRSSLQAMGGAVAFADESGRYQIKLHESGEYHLLILSRSVGRSESSSDSATVETLSRYFDRAEQLLGQLAYRFETIRFSGNTVVPLDAGFDAQN